MSTSRSTDEKGNFLGDVDTEQAHAEGVRDAMAVVYVTNSKGDILVQVCADGRKDHSAAGHVRPGEDYLQTAVRSMGDNLGITGVELKLAGDAKTSETSGAIKHYFRIYTCVAEPGELKADEVKKVFWADPFQILLDMGPDVTDTLYTGAFKESIKTYLREVL